jgi:hypothetical protein
MQELFRSPFIHKAMSAIAQHPTTNIDNYLGESIIPRIKADPKLLDEYFCKATNYPFSRENPPPKLNVYLRSKLSTITNNKPNENNNNDDDNSQTIKKSSSSHISYADIKNRIAVVECDCLLRAKQLVDSKQFKNVSVLNMANEWNVGGGWSVMRGSQEEYLFRNSTLPFSLWKRRQEKQDAFRPWAAGTNVIGPALSDPKERWYPFKQYGGAYSYNVEVFAINDQPLSESKQEPFLISVVTSAAPDLRRKSDDMMKNYDEDLRNKMRTIFLMAMENSVDCLVLGAYGCGAFLSKPEVVSRAFAEIIFEICSGCESVDQFPFKKIDFAIIKSKENLTEFCKTFEQ